MIVIQKLRGKRMIIGVSMISECLALVNGIHKIRGINS